MKLYEKIIDGQQHCKPASKIIIIKDGMQTFNPTEEMLLEDGWKVHVPVVYEQSEEEFEQHRLMNEKEYLKDDIIRYDSSDDVNVFYINDESMWLDKQTRSGLMLRFQAETALGKTETTLWGDGKEYILPLTIAIQMLYVLEVYASACYDNTQRHLSNVDKLESIDDIKSYDYRDGYPEKLTFNTGISQ